MIYHVFSHGDLLWEKGWRCVRTDVVSMLCAWWVNYSRAKRKKILSTQSGQGIRYFLLRYLAKFTLKHLRESWKFRFSNKLTFRSMELYKYFRIADWMNFLWTDKWTARQNMYLWTRAPSEDSDQTAQSRSLIRIFTGRSLHSQGSDVSFCEQRRPWSDCVDAQSYLNLRWAHMSESTFSQPVAQLQYIDLN